MRDRQQRRGCRNEHKQSDDSRPRMMNRARMETSPRSREQQQRQQVGSEADELKRSGGNVRADRSGPVLCLGLSSGVPRRIVRIERG